MTAIDHDHSLVIAIEHGHNLEIPIEHGHNLEIFMKLENDFPLNDFFPNDGFV